MSQILSIASKRSQRRTLGLSRAFEAEYCGSANATADLSASHPRSAKFLNLEAHRHLDETKPRMWQEPTSKLWKCQIDTVAGTGTTQRAAWSQLWAMLKITHPWLKKPEAK